MAKYLVIALAVLGGLFWGTLRLPISVGTFFDVTGSYMVNFPSDVVHSIADAVGWMQRLAVLLLAAIDSLKVFAIIYVMTSGGPNHSSEVLSTWAYFQAFTANKVGYGSAILVVLLLITFALAYIQVTRFQPREDY